MKKVKNTIIKARAVNARAEDLPPIPATTPEMIGHYRRHLQLGHQDRELLLLSPFIPLGPEVTANPDADPFVIRLSDPTLPEGRVAYLLLRNGAVEWRYHHSWIRHARCPIVQDPVLMQWLDGLFAAFYLDAGLPGSLDGALEMLGPWDRMRWVQTYLFEGGRPEETLTEDKNHFRYTACCEGEDAEFYFLRYGKREAMAFPAGQAEPLLHLAGIVNSILQPDYELRRFCDKKLGKDGILMPLAPNDWEALITAYGPMAIEARFSPIHTHIKAAKGRRRTMSP